MSGLNIVFADLEDSFKRTKNFNKIWSKIHKNRYRPYFRFVGKNYSIVGILTKYKQDYLILKDDNGNQYKMELTQEDSLGRVLPSYLLTEDIEKEAKDMIGETIWLNNTQDPKSFFNLSDSKFKRFERVLVLDAFPYQNNNSDHPVWLKVESKLKGIGYVRYNGDEGRVGVQDHYYISDPLPRSWGKQIIKKVLNKKVEVGMKDRQVRISIGNPDDVNITSSRYGVGEQWIYLDQNGYKTYYQFEYGKLTYIGD
tara:strand:- start:5190 stop:5951 length:762 start_codon:yes stop_codon:yes gene_type:complete